MATAAECTALADLAEAEPEASLTYRVGKFYTVLRLPVRELPLLVHLPGRELIIA